MVATSHSILRRLADSRYATRWFVGAGVDVGGGSDSLGEFIELFPMATSIINYDQMQGDAQLMTDVPDCTFDFLYSSHCLEHLDDPVVALFNWVRVVKPGGHLIVSVPDEDLYEQGHWPSLYNGEHKTSWTILKSESWSTGSTNVVDLLRYVSDRTVPIKIELIDHGYRYSRKDDHQTLYAMVEAAIEFVIRRVV
jgi:SAM-dependent methyltransferase